MREKLKTFLTFDGEDICVTRHGGELEILSIHSEAKSDEEIEDMYNLLSTSQE